MSNATNPPTDRERLQSLSIALMSGINDTKLRSLRDQLHKTERSSTQDGTVDSATWIATRGVYRGAYDCDKAMRSFLSLAGLEETLSRLDK